MNFRRLFELHARPSPVLIELDRDSVKKLNTLDAVGSVDKTNGIIRGVSVITSGVTARGHKLEIDDTTVDQLFECGSGMGKVPVKLNHKSGIIEVIGYLQDFYRDGSKLRADWHLLTEHSEYKATMEKAERMPECFGLSAAFMGDSVTKEGEIIHMDDKGKSYVKTKAGGKRMLSATEKAHARCDELVSVDCVATPAANPDGLLDARFDSGEEDKTMSKPATLEDVLSALGGIQETLTAQGERLDASEKFQQDLLETINSEQDDDDDEGEEGDEGEGEGEGEEGDGGEEGAGEGEGEGEGVGAGQPAGAGAELSRDLGRALTYLEGRFERKEKAQQDEEINFAVGVLREKITMLAAENEALHELVQSGGGKAVALSAEDSRRTHYLGQNPTDEYEERVAFHLEAGKTGTQAIQLAMKEEGGALYREHMQNLGVLK